MSQTEATGTELRAMRAGIDRARSTAAGLRHEAEQVLARAAAAGFGGIVAGLSQVRDRIGELQVRLGAAAESVDQASAALAAVPKEGSAAEVVTALNRVVERVNASQERVGVALGEVGEVRTLVGRVLQGGDPGPMLSMLGSVNEILALVAQRGTAARQSLTGAVGDAQRIGSSGN